MHKTKIQTIKEAPEKALELSPKLIAFGLFGLMFLAWFHETMKPEQMAQAGELPIMEEYSPPPKPEMPLEVEGMEPELKPEVEPESSREVKSPFGDWQGLVDYAIANPFKGTVFTEGKYKGNHLQIAKDLRMQHYQGVQGCHPYILAAIHYSETGLQMTNGNNGQGVFQHYSSGIRYSPNSYPDDFAVQAQRTCDILRNKIGGADLSTLDDFDTIGIALAKYNGCWSPDSQMFANESMHSSTPWTLCPYTANKMNEHTQGMKQCATDGCGSVNIRKTYGTMAFIAHLLAVSD
jgi:hypothetical protein